MEETPQALSHEQFVAAFHEGRIKVEVDRKGAIRLVSARLLLPLFLLPVFGLAVALAIAGYLITGIAIFAGAWLVRFFIRSSSPGFVLSSSLRDPAFYTQALGAGLLRIRTTDRP
jgi:predicted membrane-bound spermidine synthase